jgi:hypothetical protein
VFLDPLKKLRGQLLKSLVFGKCYGRKEGMKEAGNLKG